MSYTYHPQMLLNSLSGSSTYVHSTQYDASGRVELRTLLPGGAGGPGLQTDYQYFLWNAANGQGRLQRLQSGSVSNPASLQNLEYNYDAVGNINWIKDYLAGSPQTQCFTYDSLDRLTSAAASGCAYGNYSPITTKHVESSIDCRPRLCAPAVSQRVEPERAHSLA